MPMASKSTSKFQSASSDNRTGIGGDAYAPIAAAGSTQTIDNGVTDSRNFGTALGNLGNNNTVSVSTSDPAVTLGALGANAQVSQIALASNVAATQEANETARQSFAAVLAGQNGAMQTAQAALASNADTAALALGTNQQTSLAAVASNVSATQSALAANADTTAMAFGANTAATGRSLDSVDLANRLGLAAQANTQDKAFNFGSDALTGVITAQHEALDTIGDTTRQSFKFGENTLDLLAAMDARRSAEVTGTINSSTDQAREAAARSESIVKDTLSKLADQRAPDGTNITKLALWLGIAAAGVFALFIYRRKGASS